MDLKDLKALLKVLRDSGVTSYDTPELKLTLSEHFSKSKKTEASAEAASEIDDEWDKLSDEDKLLWSAGGQ
jgi:hypothetical protein